MFASLYTLSIHIAIALAHFVARFHLKTRKWVEGQSNWQSNIKYQISNIKTSTAQAAQVQRPTSNFKSQTSKVQHQNIWFHAASLGEFEQGRPVIEAVRKTYPNAKIVLTFFSPSGYEIQKDYDQVDAVCYLPADTPANVQQFLDEIQPDMALFIKYEFWFNYLHELKKRKIPTLLFSAIFRPNQLFFKWYEGGYRKMLFCFDHILVQNQASQNLLQSVHYSNVTLAGDTRLDRVVQIAKQVKKFPEIEQFKRNEQLLVIGSAWPDDMEILIPFLNKFNQPLKVIIAPHEINSEQIEKWREQLRRGSLRFTEYGERRIGNGEGRRRIHGMENEERLVQDSLLTTHYSLLFLDTIGMLSSVYRYADFAYIGGAFGDGLHNILEPAVFGIPIFFGQPHYQKFQEAHDLLRLGGATSVADTEGFRKSFTEVYENQALRNQKATICRDYVQQNAGATDKVMEVIDLNF